MAYNPIPPNGQATMANSQPVVVASDQSSLLVSPRVVGTTPVTLTAANSLLATLSNGNAVNSGRIDISYSTTGNNYSDVLIGIRCTTGTSVPTGEKAVYVYIVPWYKVNNTPTWIPASVGASTDIGDTPSTFTPGTVHSMKLASVLPTNGAGTILSDVILLSNVLGRNLPDGFSIVVQNVTGFALQAGTTGAQLAYTRLI